MFAERKGGFSEQLRHKAPCALRRQAVRDNEEESHRKFGGCSPVESGRARSLKYAGDRKTEGLRPDAKANGLRV